MRLLLFQPVLMLRLFLPAAVAYRWLDRGDLAALIVHDWTHGGRKRPYLGSVTRFLPIPDPGGSLEPPRRASWRSTPGATYGTTLTLEEA